MLAALATVLTLSAAPVTSPGFPAPRLTLFITVDALGTDVLLRNRAHFRSGLQRLLSKGAFFPNARYEQAETVTATGHAILSTGAYPWRTGVVGNRTVNRATGKAESIYTDPGHPVLEATKGSGDTSPERLMSETLSDRLRMFTQGRGKALAIAAKGRAAIGQAGRLGTPWWFSEEVGKFVTGTYYAKEFPAWVKAFNEKKIPDGYFGTQWELLLPATEYVGEDERSFERDWAGLGRTFPHPLSGGLAAPGAKSREALQTSPMMGDVLVQFAKAAMDGEHLGQDTVPDVLFVSFSPIDRVYHEYGPFSWELQDALARLDRSIGELVTAAEKAAGGNQNLLVVLAADHGGAAVPEEWLAAGMPGRRVAPKELAVTLNEALAKKFGAPLCLGIEGIDVYLDAKTIEAKKLPGPEVRRFTAQWLETQGQALVAVARDDLNAADERLGYARALRLSYYPERSGDVLMVQRPFSVLAEEEATAHGQPFAYDAQIPVVFSGRGVKPGFYPLEIHPVDVAPTVTTLWGMGYPAQCEGVPRAEAIS